MFHLHLETFRAEQFDEGRREERGRDREAFAGLKEIQSFPDRGVRFDALGEEFTGVNFFESHREFCG